MWSGGVLFSPGLRKESIQILWWRLHHPNPEHHGEFWSWHLSTRRPDVKVRSHWHSWRVHCTNHLFCFSSFFCFQRPISKRKRQFNFRIALDNGAAGIVNTLTSKFCLQVFFSFCVSSIVCQDGTIWTLFANRKREGIENESLPLFSPHDVIGSLVVRRKIVCGAWCLCKRQWVRKTTAIRKHWTFRSGCSKQLAAAAARCQMNRWPGSCSSTAAVGAGLSSGRALTQTTQTDIKAEKNHFYIFVFFIKQQQRGKVKGRNSVSKLCGGKRFPSCVPRLQVSSDFEKGLCGK